MTILRMGSKVCWINSKSTICMQLINSIKLDIWRIIMPFPKCLFNRVLNENTLVFRQRSHSDIFLSLWLLIFLFPVTVPLHLKVHCTRTSLASLPKWLARFPFSSFFFLNSCRGLCNKTLTYPALGVLLFGATLW